MKKPYEIQPGLGWRTARRVTQALAVIAIFVGPILGGWQRAYRGTMSAWQMRGWDLPTWLAELLPAVPSQTVYESNKLIGGGAAVDYFSIPVSDPVLSTVALVWGQNTSLAILAWVMPLVLALLFGRVFCGWFCPFGTLARALDRLLSLLPFKHRGFELPVPGRRPVRFVLLGLAIVAGALGGEWLTFALLPHVLAQHAVYSLLLLGGVGAIGGAFAGLVLMGILFGPTLYCATLCPTGAALGLLGRGRIARVTVPDPDACGSCTLCHRACWLGLRPRQDGNPGPDCDLCTRCFTACPKSKMVVRLTKPRVWPTRLATALLLCGITVGYGTDAYADDTSHHKPELVLNGYRETPDFVVAVTVLDLTGTRYTLDTEIAHGSEISAYVVRGNKSALDREGRRAPDGEVHHGKLTLRVTDSSGKLIDTLQFERSNAPRSAPRRTIYRRRVPFRLEPGATVTVDPVAGIFDEPMTWTVPDVHPARDGNVLAFLLAGLLTFGGLLSLALGVAAPRPE